LILIAVVAHIVLVGIHTGTGAGSIYQTRFGYANRERCPDWGFFALENNLTVVRSFYDNGDTLREELVLEPRFDHRLVSEDRAGDFSLQFFVDGTFTRIRTGTGSI
jgi:hypothetical protein